MPCAASLHLDARDLPERHDGAGVEPNVEELESAAHIAPDLHRADLRRLDGAGVVSRAAEDRAADGEAAELADDFDPAGVVLIATFDVAADLRGLERAGLDQPRVHRAAEANRRS
jgi:hypothetical protein